MFGNIPHYELNNNINNVNKSYAFIKRGKGYTEVNYSNTVMPSMMVTVEIHNHHMYLLGDRVVYIKLVKGVLLKVTAHDFELVAVPKRFWKQHKKWKKVSSIVDVSKIEDTVVIYKPTYKEFNSDVFMAIANNQTFTPWV